jgi:hypothetical protein
LFPSCFASARAWVSCAATNCFNCAEAPDLSSDHDDDDVSGFLPHPAKNDAVPRTATRILPVVLIGLLFCDPAQ